MPVDEGYFESLFADIRRLAEAGHDDSRLFLFSGRVQMVLRERLLRSIPEYPAVERLRAGPASPRAGRGLGRARRRPGAARAGGRAPDAGAAREPAAAAPGPFWVARGGRRGGVWAGQRPGRRRSRLGTAVSSQGLELVSQASGGSGGGGAGGGGVVRL